MRIAAAHGNGVHVGALADEATEAATHGAAREIAQSVVKGASCAKVDTKWVLDHLDPVEDKALGKAFVAECDRQAKGGTLPGPLARAKSSPWTWIAGAAAIVYVFWRYNH